MIEKTKLKIYVINKKKNLSIIRLKTVKYFVNGIHHIETLLRVI